MHAQVTVMQSSGQVVSACSPCLGYHSSAVSLYSYKGAVMTLTGFMAAGWGMLPPGEE